MKFDANFEVGFADAETKRRFSWTTEVPEEGEDPPENPNPAIEVADGVRWMGVAPMAFDGTKVYTLVYHYEGTKVDHEKRKAMFMETY